MSKEVIKKAIEDKELICPDCSKPITKFDNCVETVGSIWGGAGDSNVETAGVKVTLICGNEACSWQERTEYWENFLADE